MPFKKKPGSYTKAYNHAVKVKRLSGSNSAGNSSLQNTDSSTAFNSNGHSGTAITDRKPTPILVLEYLYEDWLTGNTLYCLSRDKQWDVHFVSLHHNNAFRFLPGIKSYSHYTLEKSEDRFLAFVKQVAQKTKAELLVPATSASFQFVLRHKEALQQFIDVMPMPREWAYEIASDKGSLAEFMLQNHIPGPLTLFDLGGNLEKKLEDFPFPVLLKPKTGAGGKGATGEPPITLFTDKEALLACIKHYQIADRYVIQTYVEGYEVDCNVLYKEGKLIAFSIQKALVKVDSFAPSPGLEFIQHKEVITIVDALMSKLKWNGVAHIDLIFDGKTQQLMVLEINPRFWQTVVASLVGSNVNFPSLACMQGLNRPVAYTQGRAGKYIALIPYLKYQLAGNTNKKAQFGWNAIDMRYSFAMLAIKAFRFCRRLFGRAFLSSYGVAQTSFLLCPYTVYTKADLTFAMITDYKSLSEEMLQYCFLMG